MSESISGWDLFVLGAALIVYWRILWAVAEWLEDRGWLG